MNFEFDANDIPEERPIENGWVLLEIEGAELKSNDNGWAGVAFTCKLLEGDSAGRYVFPLYSLMGEGEPFTSPNVPGWVKTSVRVLNQARECCGLPARFTLNEDTVQQFVGKRAAGKVKQRKKKDEDDDPQYDVVGWTSEDSGDASFGAPSF